MPTEDLKNLINSSPEIRIKLSSDTDVDSDCIFGNRIVYDKEKCQHVMVMVSGRFYFKDDERKIRDSILSPSMSISICQN